ncbi:MAG TPA: hypothetical protein VE135_17425 [Pyrinomonadaceae bacterium]|nr:hypothetical protein [Pyrinomonadaceae bacterium]
MKLSRSALVLIVLLVLHAAFAQRNVSAERAWKPFFSAFRTAVKKRDRASLKQMMVPDFYFSAGGGDDSGDGDSRDEAFQFFSEPYTHGWKAFDKALAQGSVPIASWWDHGAKREYASRISPPAANIRTNIDRARVAWLAIFEFRDGRWYCTSFSECCD